MDETESADLPDKDMFNFSKIDGRVVVYSFDGRVITTNSGILLTAELVDRHPYFLSVMTAFGDYRNQDMVAHTFKKLFLQGILKAVAGYANHNHSDVKLEHCRIITPIQNGAKCNKRATLSVHPQI